MKNGYKETDQKWGWLIVFGNIICFFVLYGHVRSFGIFVVPIQETFDVNVATVGSIMTARSVGGMIAVLTAPALSDRFTERKVVITASLINVIGSILVFFLNHIISFYVWAFIFGLAVGYTNIPTQITIGKYFQRRRSLALTICSSGSTLGQLILPPLCTFIMEKYGLVGTFLIVGGISLNCIAAGALQRPFKVQSVTKQNGAADEDDMMNGSNTLARQSTSDEGEFEDRRVPEQNSEVETVSDNYDANDVGTEIGHEFEDKMIPAINEKQTVLADSSDGDSALGNNKINDSLSKIAHVDILSVPRVDDSNIAKPNDAQITRKRSPVIVSKDAQTVSDPKNSALIYQQTKRFLQRQFDVSLLKLPRFTIVILINATAHGFIVGSYVYLIAMSKERDVGGELSLLLTVNACTDIPGRFVIAMIIDTKILRAHHVILLCNILSAVAICVYPLAQEYWSMMVVSAIMGLSSHASMDMALPVVVDLVGVPRMSKGLGWYTFVMAVASAITRPFLGMIRDVTGTYDVVFYLSGACIVALVLAYFIVSFIIEHTVQKGRRPTEKEMNDETENIHLTEPGEVLEEST